MPYLIFFTEYQKGWVGGVKERQVVINVILKDGVVNCFIWKSKVKNKLSFRAGRLTKTKFSQVVSRCHWSWCRAWQGGASLLPPNCRPCSPQSQYFIATTTTRSRDSAGTDLACRLARYKAPGSLSAKCRRAMKKPLGLFVVLIKSNSLHSQYWTEYKLYGWLRSFQVTETVLCVDPELQIIMKMIHKAGSFRPILYWQT